MPPVVVDASLHIRIIWTLAGNPLGENSLFAEIGAGAVVDQPMANTIAGHLSTALSTSGILPLLNDQVSCESITIRDVRTPNQALIDAAVGVAGSSLEDLLPRGNALVVTARTLLAGRSFRGRTYLLGWAENATGADGRATPAAQTAANDLMVDFNNLMAGEGMPLGVASLVSQGVPRDPGIITPISGFVVRDAQWDRQWRRARR